MPKDADNEPTAADLAVPIDALSDADFANMHELFAEDRDITCLHCVLEMVRETLLDILVDAPKRATSAAVKNELHMLLHVATAVLVNQRAAAEDEEARRLARRQRRLGPDGHALH